MDALSIPYFHFMWDFEASNSTWVPLQPSCDSNHTHFQQAFNSHCSWAIACTDQKESFTARNRGPTLPENCFLSIFVQRRREKAPPLPTKWLFKASHAVYNFGCIHPTTSPCPTLSVCAKTKSQAHSARSDITS